jgi:hypothetical protein
MALCDEFFKESSFQRNSQRKYNKTLTLTIENEDDSFHMANISALALPKFIHRMLMHATRTCEKSDTIYFPVF